MIHTNNVKSSMVQVSIMYEHDPCTLVLTDWWNGEGADLYVEHGNKDYHLSLPGEAWAGLRKLLKSHNYGKGWSNESEETN